MLRSKFNSPAFGLTMAVAAVCPALSHGAEATSDASANIPSVVIAAKHLDEARNGLSPDTGSTVYHLDTQDIANLPLGESTPLNQVILQTPGVVQGSFGQLYMRGDHANLQYRINGVVIPESISGFGQTFDARFIDQLNIQTGALPAQYGYRTAGIVDIHTRGSRFDRNGSLELVGGQHSYREAGGSVSGGTGALSYFLTGAYVRNDLGIENPIGEKNAIHDETKQARGFGYLSYVLGDDSRVGFMFGLSDNRFQIPNVPGEVPTFALSGAPATIDSAMLDANQREKNRFEVLSYQRNLGSRVDYQVSAFHRYTDVNYHPDPIGDLVFRGAAAEILRRNEAYGMQADLSDSIGAAHTLRAGVFYSHESFDTHNHSLVFPAGPDGSQTDTAPLTIVDHVNLRGNLFGIYLQDEWKPTPALTVNYGARFDKTNIVVDENQLSPRVGLVYDLSPELRAHAGYARYFTPPPTEIIDTTSVAKFQGTTNALPSDANTAVRSERSDYYDVGLSYRATPQFTVGIDGYYRDVRHLQDEGQFGSALIFSAFNYERAKIYGIELSSSYRAGNFSAYANVAHSLARGKGLESGQFNFPPDEIDFINRHWVHLDHDQRLSSSVGVAYKLYNTTLSADGLYGSGLRNDFANTGHLPSYAQVNASVMQTLELGEFGRLDARVSVVNLFDKSYLIRDGSGIGVGAPQFGARRAVYVSLARPF